MKIMNLYIENVKKIKVVEITPDGNVVVIQGPNASGKTSTMDSICMALGGKKLIPEKPVRDGEQTAKIVVDMGDYIVTRWWTSPITSYVKLETKEGSKVSNAQTILDGIVGNLTFDPLEFSTIEPKKRLKILQEITKLDFTAHDKQYKELEEKRRGHHRDGEQTAALLKTYEDIVEPVDDMPRSIEKIKQDKQWAKKKNDEIEKARKSHDDSEQLILDYNLGIKRCWEEIARQENDIKEKMESVKQLEKAMLVLGEEAKKDPEILDKFDDEIEKYHAFNAGRKRLNDKIGLETKLGQERSDWEECSKEMKEIIEEKETAIATAQMPIPGITFGEGEVIYKGIPFAQLCSSEQIKVSFAMAIAINPRLKIAMIKNGSLLDDNAMKYIGEIAKLNDYQVWIEKVSTSPEAGAIYIEDGQTVKVPQEHHASV